MADVLINHGIDNPTLFSIEPYTKLCLGLEWLLLRKPFIDASIENVGKEKQTKIEKVVVSFGGVDWFRLTDKVIKILSKAENVKNIDAIVGNEYCTKINESINNVHFHRAVTAQAMAKLFSNCDLAVLSASTTCMEALACRAIVAAGYYVDNQKEFYHLLEDGKMIYGLGNLLNEEWLEQLTRQVKAGGEAGVRPRYFHLENIRQNYIDVFKELNYD